MDRQYIIDSNILIASSRRLYPFDIMPGFWEQLAEKGKGKIILIDKVKDEIFKNEDELSAWLRKNEDEFISKDMNDASVVSSYGEIMQSVADNTQYFEAAKSEFASVADSWICAHARAYNYIAVTLEKFEPNSKKRVLIPNVCKEFEIEYIDIVQFLREIKMYIT